MAPPHSPHAPRDAVFWFDRKASLLPALTGTQRADVVVVGGGMMGLMAARILAARGRAVCLVEADTCGGAASGRSSGFITPDSELELTDLESHFGEADAPRLWNFASGGVEAIRDAIVEHRIACDYQVQDSLFVAVSRRGARQTREEHETHRKFGYRSTLYSEDTIGGVLGGQGFHGAIRFGGTFGLDAYRCCVGLRAALVAAGVRVFESSPVTRLRGDGIDTAGGSIRADQVLVCTDRFLPRLGLARREVYHAQTFLAISEPLERSAAHALFPGGPMMVWDTDLLYRYLRLTGDGRLLLGGSTLLATYARHERHRPGQSARLLQRYLRTHFPGLAVRFAAIWPGLIGISPDFAPVVGRDPVHPSIHYAGGAGGLPWAAALGGYLAEKILSGRDELDALLTVDRTFPLPRAASSVIGKPAAFALAHGRTKFLG